MDETEYLDNARDVFDLFRNTFPMKTTIGYSLSFILLFYICRNEEMNKRKATCAYGRGCHSTKHPYWYRVTLQTLCMVWTIILFLFCLHILQRRFIRDGYQRSRKVMLGGDRGWAPFEAAISGQPYPWGSSQSRIGQGLWGMRPALQAGD